MMMMMMLMMSKIGRLGKYACRIGLYGITFVSGLLKRSLFENYRKKFILVFWRSVYKDETSANNAALL